MKFSESALETMDDYFDAVGRYHLAYFHVERTRWLTIVASRDHDGAPTIEIYKNRELKRWYKRAVKFWRNIPPEEKEKWTVFDAIWETQ